MKYQLDNMQEIVLNHGKCQLDIAPDSFEMAESTVSGETPCYKSLPSSKRVASVSN